MKKIHIAALTSLTIVILSAMGASAKVSEQFPTLTQVVKDLQKQMEAGDPEAASILVDLSLDGFLRDNSSSGIIDYDREMLKKILEKAYPNAGGHATYIYGFCIQNGTLGFKKNKEEGLKIVDAAIPKLKELAEKNDGFACLQLYYIYSYGQSNESKNLNEATKYLQRGFNLKNPLCVFYATKNNLISTNSNQLLVDETLGDLESLQTYFRFPTEKVRDLYRDAILQNFNKQKFQFINFKVDGDNVYALFKNNRLKYSLYLTYKILDTKGTINKVPILSFVYDNPRYHDLFNYAIDIFTLNNFMASWEKIEEWSQKVSDIQPPAFSKCINVKREENEKPIHFTWDGKNTIWLEEGYYPNGFQMVDGRPQESTGEFQSKVIESLSSVSFFLQILTSVTDIDNDVHSFNKTVQNGLKNQGKSQQEKEDIINSSFN